MSDSETGDTYRVVLHFAGNSKTTLYVRAPSRYTAETQARREYERGIVRSCLPREPPEDAEVLVYERSLHTDNGSASEGVNTEP